MDSATLYENPVAARIHVGWFRLEMPHPSSPRILQVPRLALGARRIGISLAVAHDPSGRVEVQRIAHLSTDVSFYLKKEEVLV